MRDELLRVTGDGFIANTAGSVYTIRFWDTTYGIPRWNNTASQTTVFLVQNMTQRPVFGDIRLFSAAGSLLYTHSFTLAANSLLTFNTASVALLAGQSGHAYVIHNAGYGGLSGKAVALEPSTGFTFDTPMQPIVH